MSQYVTVEQYAVSKGEDADTYELERVQQIAAKLTEASNIVDVWARPVVIDADDVTDDGPFGALIPIIIRMAARGIFNPMEVQGEQIGDYSYQTPGSVQATKGEKRFIRRVVGISPISAVDAETITDIPQRYGYGEFLP